jgi:hypothetical protein
MVRLQSVRTISSKIHDKSWDRDLGLKCILQPAITAYFACIYMPAKPNGKTSFGSISSHHELYRNAYLIQLE